MTETENQFTENGKVRHKKRCEIGKRLYIFFLSTKPLGISVELCYKMRYTLFEKKKT